MNVIINGALQPAEHASVSIFDRGFLYGDGLFETLRISEGQLLFWDEHWNRLESGAEFLHIPLPAISADLKAHAKSLIASNQVQDAMLRLTVTRGKAGQGYLPSHAVSPTWIMHTRPAPNWNLPQVWRIGVSGFRVPQGSSLHRIKSLDKLLQVMSRLEVQEENMDEALILNTANQIAEATSCNIFALFGNRLVTPPDAAPALPGVTRNVVMSLAASAGYQAEFAEMTLEELYESDAVFLTASSWGVVEVSHVGAHPVKRSPSTADLRVRFLANIKNEVEKERDVESAGRV